MKKLTTFVLVFLTFNGLFSQNTDDALLYATDDLNGTARFRAMSGAFGSLGGDFSSLSINPAGSSVFANTQITATFNNFNVRNEASYFGSETSKKNNSLNLNQAGIVFVLENTKAKDWNKFAFAVNYDKKNNYDNALTTTGINSNSIANYFLSYANGLDLNIVNGNQFEFGSLFYNEQQAYLGYNAYVINEDPNYSSTNKNYVSLVPSGGNYLQVNQMETMGYNSKLSFNASGQFKDKFYFGINLNSYYIDYIKSASFQDRNSNNTSVSEYLISDVTFLNDLYTYGTGFSFQLGTIFKPTKTIRIGLAYESPTWYRISEELTQNVIGVSATASSQSVTDFGNANPITMIYEPYRLQTPGKWNSSLAYVFGKKGLISFDYTIKDFRNTSFRPNKVFTAQNNEINTVLDVSNEFRVGGEYKIKQLSIRAGYRFEESPYKNKKISSNIYGYSGGLGYNFGGTRVDLAYSISKRDYAMQMFSQGLTDQALINNKNSTITLSTTFEL